MKSIFAAIIIAVAVASSQAHAEERVGNAALGAISGGLVFGPVGLVAGAVVGYAAGPSIARSFRGQRHPRRAQTRQMKPSAQIATRQRAPAAAPEPGVVTPQRAAPGAGGPPAQGFE